ncbi:MAG: DUF3365 domain-containing protein [Bradymonadia bacterium]
MRPVLILIGCLTLLTSACGKKAESPEDQKPPLNQLIKEDVRTRARGVLQPVKVKLKKALTTAISETGPEGAVEACRIKAPAITAGANQKLIKLGRSAARLRNPKNAPADWLKPVIEKYATGPAASGAYEVIPISGRRYGYVEPIYTGHLCTTCHGDRVSSVVRAAIAEGYPEDKAMGFKPGQFRGVFWVEMHESVL